MYIGNQKGARVSTLWMSDEVRMLTALLRTFHL